MIHLANRINLVKNKFTKEIIKCLTTQSKQSQKTTK